MNTKIKTEYNTRSMISKLVLKWKVESNMSGNDDKWIGFKVNLDSKKNISDKNSS